MSNYTIECKRRLPEGVESEFAGSPEAAREYRENKGKKKVDVLEIRTNGEIVRHVDLDSTKLLEYMLTTYRNYAMIRLDKDQKLKLKQTNRHVNTNPHQPSH